MNFTHRRAGMEEGKVLEYSHMPRMDEGKRPTHKNKGIAAMAAVKALVKGAPHGKTFQGQGRERGIHDGDISPNAQLDIKYENPFDEMQGHVSHLERQSSLINVKRHSFRITQDVERSDSLDSGYPTTRNQHSELADIESYLDRAKSELPELQGPKNESAEDSVIRIIQTYKRISGSLRDSKGRLEPVDKLKENCQRAEDELRRAERDIHSWVNFHEQEKQKFEQKIIMLNDEKEALNARYEQSLKQASDVTATQSKQISDLTVEMKSLEEDKFRLQKELDTKGFEFNQRLSEERTMFGAQTQDLNNKFGDRVKETSEMFERRFQHEKIENEARLKEAESRNTLIKQHVEQIKRDHEDKIKQLQLEMEQSQQKAREQMKQQLEEQKVNEEIMFEREHEQMKQQLLILETRLTKEREKQKVTIQELRKEHKAESNRQKAETELHLKREFAKYEEMVRRFKSQHKVDLDRQSADAEKRVREAQKRYEEEVTYMKATFLELAELKKAVDQQIPQPQHMPSLKKRLGDKPGADIRQLRALKEDYKKALSDQHYLSLKDHHIVTRFKTIASEIERLARIEWDGHRAAHWPCTENNLLRLNPQNTRKLKQYIVQSSLWVFLYERIFRSPFCMFGHEGAEMDRDWEDIYSPDAYPRKWADVLPAVEDERCANAKRCLVVIDPSTEAAPENVMLKTSYELVITAAVEAFSKLMENITSFGEAGRKTVSTIMRLCAKVWLECCSQRYRLMVRVLVSGGNILHLGPRVVPSLSLLRLPELRRYGTLQGGNFEKEETIEGWKGVVAVFPTQ